uniref:Pectinesterase inhibitor domain-containing protein n=1 Tax=Ananas comosus var. bracteatus TaxID=296719 RepID=A0A6V7QDZ1_ANACO|nr:unnamed protein product [Ananas comosus var. bracteatus]
MTPSSLSPRKSSWMWKLFFLTAAGDNISRPNPVRIFTAIVNKSLYQLDVAAAAVSDVRLRINEPEQQSALSDCMQLMDLSRDRLAAVAGGAARCNARTWVSAVLTNYGTCRDGLRGSAKASVGPQLESLSALASAALAFSTPSPRRCDRGEGREREVCDGAGGGGCSTGRQEKRKVRDLRKERSVQGERQYRKDEEERDDRRRRQERDGDHREPQRHRRLHHFNSATLAAVGDGLILQDLKIENTAGPKKHQAVALRVGADKAAINRCSIDGYQDTLYAHSLRQFYRDSHISGTIDFIFATPP